MVSPVKIWRNQKKIITLVGNVGTVISWTEIRVPPSGYSDQAPYVVVLVDFGHGGKIIAQLVDHGDKTIVVGQRVVTVIRRVIKPSDDSVIPYGIKVKPI